MKSTSLALLLAILVFSCATSTFADSIPITNASFEITNPLLYTSPGPPNAGIWNVGPIPGWTMTGVGGSFQPGPGTFTSLSNGSIVVYSNGGSISQTLSSSLAANTDYTLTVAVGNRLDAIVNNLATTYIIQLVAGNTLLNSITGSNTVIPFGTFTDVSFNYISGVAFPAGNLSIVLTSAGQQSDFDNVRLNATAVVPEPGTLALMAVGLGLMFLVFRRANGALISASAACSPRPLR